jgi:hypothetical protein
MGLLEHAGQNQVKLSLEWKEMTTALQMFKVYKNRHRTLTNLPPKAWRKVGTQVFVE